MTEILLCCGSGASSGFMAKNANDAAKLKGLNYHIFARSESEIEDYIDIVSLVMVGPHFKHRLDALRDIADEYNVPVELIEKDTYGSLDGEALVKQIQSILEK